MGRPKLAMTGASGIYVIICLESGRRYIGSAVDIASRWRVHRCDLHKHKHHSQHLQRAWNKYGEDKFQFAVLEIVDDRLMLVEREQVWLNELQPEFNSCKIAGSQLGTKRTPEQVERFRALRIAEGPAKAIKLRGRVASPETRAKIKAARALQVMRKGHKFSEAHRAAISKGTTGKKNKPRTLQHRLALSKSHLGKKHGPMSAETKAKQSAVQKIKAASESTKRNRAAARKPLDRALHVPCQVLLP